jgi:hypothetical protein
LLRLLPGAVEVGRDVGAELGFEEEAEEEGTQGMVVILLFWGRELDDGSSGKANRLVSVETLEAVPQDCVWETGERDDWAVELFSLRTRVDFGPVELAFVEEEEAPLVLAQPSGRDPEATEGPGREG